MNTLNSSSYLKLPLSSERAATAHSSLDRISLNVTDQHCPVLS